MSGQGDQPAQDIQYSYNAIKSAIIQEIDKKQTSELVDDINWLDTKSKKIKWLLLFIGVLCAATPFMPFLGLPAGIAGAIVSGGLGAAYLGQVLTSHDKIKTISKGISLVISIMTGVMIFAILPIGPLSISLALFSFMANKILYDGDITKLLKSFKHFFTRKKTPSQRFIGVLTNAVTLTAATFLAFVFTMSMYVGAAHLITGLGLTTTFIVAPYIVIPVIAFCFLSNLAFAKRGIDKLIKITTSFLSCFTKEQCIAGTIYKPGTEAVFKYLFDIEPSDKPGTKAWKAFKRIFFVTAACIAISVISQSALVNTLTSKVANFNFPGMLQLATQWVVSTAAVVATMKISRIALVIPKLTNALPKIGTHLINAIKKYPDSLKAAPAKTQIIANDYSLTIATKKKKRIFRKIDTT